MKTTRAIKASHALTLVEFVVVLFSLFILAIVLLPALSAPRVQRALGCVNQLKHTGQAFRVWEGDHGDKLPSPVPGTNGLGIAEAVFQSLSNQLGSTRLLVCPADHARLPAASFRTLTSRNVSYFVNMDANESNPQDIMSGDDNLAIRGVRVKSGLLVVSNNVPFAWAWTAERHRFSGNLMMADGSVQSATKSGLNNYLNHATNDISSTNSVWVRLAIP